MANKDGIRDWFVVGGQLMPPSGYFSQDEIDSYRMLFCPPFFGSADPERLIPAYVRKASARGRKDWVFCN